LERLSQWFGVHGTVLTWFRSYLSDRSFCVKCSGELSQPHNSCYGVLQGSVIGPLLFSLYTTPLNSLISLFGLNHHIYAYDTQLFISFQATKFIDNISCLQTWLGSIADCMTSNLLCFNSSKTEFLLLGFKPQLDKIQSPALCLSNGVFILPSASARNLGFIFDFNLTLVDQISSVSWSCFYHIRDLRRIRSRFHYCSVYWHIFC